MGTSQTSLGPWKKRANTINRITNALLAIAVGFTIGLLATHMLQEKVFFSLFVGIPTGIVTGIITFTTL